MEAALDMGHHHACFINEKIEAQEIKELAQGHTAKSSGIVLNPVLYDPRSSTINLFTKLLAISPH